MRRGVPVVLVGGGLVALLASYVAYTQRVVRELRAEARRSAQMYASVYRALGSPDEGAATAALLELSAQIARSGVPVIVTDGHGRPAAQVNVPCTVPPDGTADTPCVRDYVRELDRE